MAILCQNINKIFYISYFNDSMFFISLKNIATMILHLLSFFEVIKLRLFIIEDNFLQKDYLEKTLTTFLEKRPITVEIESFLNADEFLKVHKIDSIKRTDAFLLDIDFKTRMDGIDLAEAIRDKNAYCSIYFVTGDERKAEEIINRGILPSGYVIKNPERIETVEEQLIEIAQKLISDAQSHSSVFEIKQGNLSRFIDMNEIILVESIPHQRGYLRLHTLKENIIFRSSISQLAPQLNTPFMMTNLKSYILNLNQIQSIDKKSGYVQFRSGYEIVVSKRIIKKNPRCFR